MKFIRFLKTDVKIINSYFLIILILLILVCVGYSSYALFSFSKTSPNIIELEVGEMTKLATETLIAQTDNLNESGLYTIVHSADSTLQIGTAESVTEYRYRGANPKNYVTFNNEIWRIIGVFPTEDENGNIENRIKLIRNESIGKNSWDTNGYNNWARPATLNTYLNGDYYNTLTSEAQSMIGNAKYYLGGYSGGSPTIIQMYSYERKIGGSDYYYSTNPNSWVGKLALMYASDYGYASANCENKQLHSGDSSYDINACNTTNWLYNLKVMEWLLPQRNLDSSVYCLYSSGHINYYSTYGIVGPNQNNVRPVLYLKTAIKIIEGSGTSANPYVFGL